MARQSKDGQGEAGMDRLGRSMPGTARLGDAGQAGQGEAGEAQEQTLSLASALTKKPQFLAFSFWICGDTPLIVHAWSQKAKLEMLGKQVKAPKAGKEARDPRSDFTNSLYPMGDQSFGFPVTGIKNCILSAAHKDKGVPRSVVQSALWLNADMVRVQPAMAGSVCDMPIVRIYGSEPEQREDMVKIGSGLNKVASLAYRAQFTTWAIRVSGKFNAASLNVEQLAFLIAEAGLAYGIGEWRNERRGIFGSFHLASVEEEAEWTAFASGKGPLPAPISFAQAAE